jgi:hypothetical protein
MVLFAVGLRKVATWRPLALAGGVVAVMLLLASGGTAADNADRGLWQRVVEVGVFAWISAVAWRIATPADTPDL